MRYGKGKKVHLLNRNTDSMFAGLQCDSGLFGFPYKRGLFHPTTDPVDCKKCLKLLEKDNDEEKCNDR